jgi:hypothetical protein
MQRFSLRHTSLHSNSKDTLQTYKWYIFMACLLKEIISYLKRSHWKYICFHCLRLIFMAEILFIANSPVQCSKFKTFACKDAPVTAFLMHSLPAHTWLVAALTRLTLTLLSSARKTPQMFCNGRSQLITDSSLISDWFLTRSARDEGRPFRGGS